MGSGRKHIVQQGECLSSLAFENGFFWETLWEDPENAALKETRESPFVLQPGDVVHIPDPRQRQVSAATGARHIYRRKGVPAMLRLQLLVYNKPLANLPYVLAFGDKEITGTTDAQGKVEVYVPPNMPAATLRVGEGSTARVYNLAPRNLNPPSDPEGIQARLTNLGYYGGGLNGTLDAETTAALKRFQRDQGLDVTGQADDATVAKLASVHSGSS
jgi:hypothetical protein